MKKRNQKRNASLKRQRYIGYILIGGAVVIPLLTGGDITASLLIGLLGLAAVLANGDVDEDDEPYKLKFFYGKKEGES